MLYNKDWEQKSNPLRKRSAASPVSDLLYKAAALLEKHGHAKYVRKSVNGSMCLLGAIEVAEHGEVIAFRRDSGLTIQAAEAIIQALGIKPHKREDARFPAVNWNNADERTAQEVIDTMRLAAHLHSHKEKQNA